MSPQEKVDAVTDRINGIFREEIRKTIGIGDAKWPFHLIVDVVYKKHSNSIIVTYWEDRECPYDNPSEKWYQRVEDIIAEHFKENVIFLT